jgi:flagellar secretion chaperone FliS
MNVAYHKLGAYKQATHTVSKTRQIVMLYDGAVRFLQQARVAMQEGRVEDRYHLLTKASNIMTGLQGCLDFELDMQVSTMLYDYYAAREMEIFALHRTNSAEDCDVLILNLKAMREAWNAIDIGEGQDERAHSSETADDAGRRPLESEASATSGFIDSTLSALTVSA